MLFSLEHWLIQATSLLGQLKKHSTKFISQRSVQAKFKSGTLKSILNRAQIRHATWLIQYESYCMSIIHSPCYYWKNMKTYKHSVNGSKSFGWHVTRLSSDIKKENLIFLKFYQTLRCFIRTPYAIFPRTSYSLSPSLIMKFLHNKVFTTCTSTSISILVYMVHSRDHWHHINYEG